MNNKIYRLRIEQIIEYEYEHVWYKFYLTEEDMKKDREQIEKSNKRPDGSWIPNITSMYFEEDETTFEDAKNEMTISQFEELFNLDIADFINK